MKQIIVMRKDLKMRKGKMIAQGAHASMAVFFNRINHYRTADRVLEMKVGWEEYSEWINGIFTKICVSVNSEEELLEIMSKAEELEIPCALITDSGKTEFNGVPTKTCCAIGPADDELLNTITGELPLL